MFRRAAPPSCAGSRIERSPFGAELFVTCCRKSDVGGTQTGVMSCLRRWSHYGPKWVTWTCPKHSILGLSYDAFSSQICSSRTSVATAVASSAVSATPSRPTTQGGRPLRHDSPRHVITASAEALGPLSGLPYSLETIRALQASKEQAVLQGCMFAGPDQLLLGILSAATSGTARGGGGGGGGGGGVGSSPATSGAAAGALLAAALGGGDANSVREWLNEQAGFVTPLVYTAAAPDEGRSGSGGKVSPAASYSYSYSHLRPSDVEFTAAAREVLRRARAGADAMGSRSVGTYHLLMVLMMTVAAADSSSSIHTAAARAMLPALLRAVGADAAALYSELLALAERDEEPPSAIQGAAVYQDVVKHLRDTYIRQAALPYNERDERVFRIPTKPTHSSVIGAAGLHGQDEEEEDPYE